MSRTKAIDIYRRGSYRVYKVLNSGTYIVAHDCVYGIIKLKEYKYRKCAINRCDKLATYYKVSQSFDN